MEEKKFMGGGVILTPQSPEDKIFGSENSIGGQIKLESGDYGPYLVSVELQKKKYLDNFGCLTYSGLNDGEVQLQYDIVENKDELLKDTLDKLGCIDENGFPNFSDRFNVKMSGTIPYRGNSQRNVFTSFRHDGLVGEKYYPFPETMKLDEYYKEVPGDIVDRGKLFLEYFDVQYEWLADFLGRVDHTEVSKYGPYQVIVDANYVYKNGLIQPKSSYNYNHAMLRFAGKEGEYQLCWDHYNQVVKKFHWDYKFAVPARVSIKMKKGVAQAKTLVEKYDEQFVMGRHPGIYKIENGKKRPFAKWFDYLIFAGNKDNFSKVDADILDLVPEGRVMDVQDSPYWPFVKAHYDMLVQMSAPDNIKRLQQILDEETTGEDHTQHPVFSDDEIERQGGGLLKAIINFIKKIFNSLKP